MSDDKFHDPGIEYMVGKVKELTEQDLPNICPEDNIYNNPNITKSFKQKMMKKEAKQAYLQKFEELRKREITIEKDGEFMIVED